MLETHRDGDRTMTNVPSCLQPESHLLEFQDSWDIGLRRMRTELESYPEIELVLQGVTPEVRLLSVLKGGMIREQIQERPALKDKKHFRTAYLLPAIEAGLIEMTIPEKPRSSKQRYRLTAKASGLMREGAGKL